MVFKLIIYLVCFQFKYIFCNVLYNIPDPDCTGSFGACTDRDLAMLSYAAIKKLHEKMDDNHDGTIDIQETKGFIEDELQFKNDLKRQKKFHQLDMSITIDELWKIWMSSEVYNWNVVDVLDWLNNDLLLDKYIDNFKRNSVDGRFIPRLAANENSYLTKVLKIKDFRDRNKIIVKATDLVLFGPQSRFNITPKDIIFACIIALLTIIFVYVYLKNIKSQKKIEDLKKKFECISEKNPSLARHEKKEDLKVVDSHEKNDILTKLSVAQKDAERLKKSRLGSVNHVQRLRFAEKELEKVRLALKQRELQINMIKTQPPKQLLDLINSTYESEKALFDIRFEYIEKERNKCLNELNRLTKSNSSVLGMFWIAHSSVIEQINLKLELIQKQLKNLSIAKSEWNWRWNQIDNITTIKNEEEKIVEN